MPKYDIMVEFMGVLGSDAEDALDRLQESLAKMYQVNEPESDTDVVFIEATEVPEK